MSAHDRQLIAAAATVMEIAAARLRPTREVILSVVESLTRDHEQEAAILTALEEAVASVCYSLMQAERHLSGATFTLEDADEWLLSPVERSAMAVLRSAGA